MRRDRCQDVLVNLTPKTIATLDLSRATCWRAGARFGSGGASDNDLDPVTPKYLVKSVGEFLVPIAIKKRIGSGRFANVRVNWRAG